MTCLGDLYDLKLKMVNRLNEFSRKFPDKDTSEMRDLIKLLDSGIESAEYERLKAKWAKEDLEEWEAFT